MKHLTLILTFCVGLFFTCIQVCLAQTDLTQLEWRLAKNKKGISIYTSTVNHSRFKATKGILTINGSLEEIVSLISNPKNCTKWIYRCKESHFHEMISQNEALVYLRSNFPFPMKDRDVLMNVRFNQDKNTKEVSMLATSEPEKIANINGLIRIEQFHTQWIFKPQKDGMVTVENITHLDPNGKLPVWLINQLLIQTPYKTLNNMRKIIEQGNVVTYAIPFLK